ncbi:MAG: helix-turn-helix transcriptional regulator [Eubacteriales bacterium]|nr:helix-turn-helix transcriptional regulator [Eubacteriales bacterium]
MDCEKVGKLIRELRLEKRMTQKEVADALHLSDRTVSKWERGMGCPDVSLLAALSGLLGVNIEGMLTGDLAVNDFVGGNMKNAKYFVCPSCGNITLCTGSADVSCCGRKLTALEAKKASEEEKLAVEQIEDEWYITSEHPMKKDDYISFIAFATGDKVFFLKQYPEWSVQARIPKREHGKLIWYDTKRGLFYQTL